MTFNKKVIWITGASSGIGEALTYTLAERGAHIIISARREQKLQKVKSNCGAAKSNILILPLDLADHEQLPEKCEQALEHFGHIDYLFNNGGVSQRSLAVDTDIEVVKRIMAINYTGTVLLTTQILPSMIDRGEGHVIVTSSVMGKFGTPMRSSYAASKHALQGYFESLRHEMEPHNINVTIVCPGFIHTDVSVNALTANGQKYEKMAPGQNDGMDPKIFAQKLLKAVKKNKKEVYIGGTEILSIYLKKWAPGLLNWLIKRVDTT